LKKLTYLIISVLLSFPLLTWDAYSKSASFTVTAGTVGKYYGVNSFDFSKIPLTEKGAYPLKKYNLLDFTLEDPKNKIAPSTTREGILVAIQKYKEEGHITVSIIYL
jgi:hypothetical protein